MELELSLYDLIGIFSFVYLAQSFDCFLIISNEQIEEKQICSELLANNDKHDQVRMQLK